MGCVESRSRIGVLSDNKDLKNPSFPSYTQIINEKCPKIRTDIIKEAKYFTMDAKRQSIDFKYIYLSQRGYYPNAMGKANQDSYTICENMLGDKNCYLFGIFDGHGEYGDHCSYYCAEKLPFYLQQAMNEYGGTSALNDTKSRENIFMKSFDATNKALRKSNVDDHLSGTTGITVIIKDSTLYVCNVGDSRAIIGGQVDGHLKYSALSSDQTPYRADERERLKKCGATIMTLDQLEGREPIHENWGAETGDTIDESGDPPRVWDKSLERPGCAFTRSFGDAVAETIGVNAVPEILTWELTSYDKYIIIASDGVFEFLTSQNVVNIISQYQDIIEGARRVIEESYRLWLTYDERTDDISIIIISLENYTDKKIITKVRSSIVSGMKSVSMRSSTNSNYNKSSYTMHLPDNKPVRRVISKVRRKEISENWVSDDDYDYDFAKHAIQKTPEELARIADMVKANFMFQNISPVQRDQIFQVMQLKYVNQGQCIIKQGDEGDEMYIVDSGEFFCTKKDDDGVTQPVLSYTTPGSSFGELSLMYGKPRAASVKAVTDGRLWVLGRKAYRAVLVKRKQDDLLQTMQSIPILNDLSFMQLQRLCENSIEKNFNDGETISYDPHDAVPVMIKGPSTIRTPTGRDIVNMHVSSPKKSKSVCLTIDTSLSSEKRDDRFNPELWMVCIILSGRIELIGKDNHPNRFRGIRSYVISIELGKYYSSMKAEGRVKVAYISQSLLLEVAGEKMRRQLVDAISTRNAFMPMSPILLSNASQATTKRANIKMPLDLHYHEDEGYMVKSTTNRVDYIMDHAIATVGDYAYIGTFVYEGTLNNTLKGKRMTGKIIAKKRAALNHMDAKLLQEKQILHMLKQDSIWLPMIHSIIQDSKSILILYNSYLICDLSFAISSNVMTDASRIFYLACIYNALKTLHSNGIIHRFVNEDSIYISDRGLAKLCDMRYAKRMNGSKSFTICGDPLYFACEMINGQGYNYAVDLWALGVVAFEMFEGRSPIATIESDETTIFNAITKFRNMELVFLKATTSDNARDFIRSLLNPDVDKRLGYKSTTEVQKHVLFKETKWELLHLSTGHPVAVNAGVDPAMLFDEADLEQYKSAVFDRF